jgi:DNA-binding transcriptional MocR family regulator
MLGALDTHLVGQARWSEPAGGYFLWLDLPVDAGKLLGRAEAAGVSFVKGADFFAGGGGEHAARLAFSYASLSEIDEGVSVLASLLR